MLQFKTPFNITYTAIEIRNAATNLWGDTQGPNDAPLSSVERARAVVDGLCDIGLTAWYSQATRSGEHLIMIDPSDRDGRDARQLKLWWNCGIDGYDYDESADDGLDHGGIAVENAQHEPEPTNLEPTKTTVIDITPRWAGMIGLLISMAGQAGKGRQMAIDEIVKLAVWADQVNADPVTKHRIELLEVVRIALTDDRVKDIVAGQMDISDERVNELANIAVQILEQPD